MHAPETQLKPLASLRFTPEETKMLSWLKSAKWEPDAKLFKAKVPEFFGGIRLYQMQGAPGAGGAQGTLGLFIKKLEYQGVLSKQDMYPVSAVGAGRYLSLKKIDLDNLGVGQDNEDED